MSHTLVSLAIIPLHHSAGLFGLCFFSTLGPGTLAILSKWNINVALRVIPKSVDFSLYLVPYPYFFVLMSLFIFIGTRFRP